MSGIVTVPVVVRAEELLVLSSEKERKLVMQAMVKSAVEEAVVLLDPTQPTKFVIDYRIV